MQDVVGHRLNASCVGFDAHGLEKMGESVEITAGLICSRLPLALKSADEDFNETAKYRPALHFASQVLLEAISQQGPYLVKSGFASAPGNRTVTNSSISTNCITFDFRQRSRSRSRSRQKVFIERKKGPKDSITRSLEFILSRKRAILIRIIAR